MHNLHTSVCRKTINLGYLKWLCIITILTYNLEKLNLPHSVEFKVTLGLQKTKEFTSKVVSVSTSVCVSVCPCVDIKIDGGRGQSQKRFSNFFRFGMELLWDDIDHISKDRFG